MQTYKNLQDQVLAWLDEGGDTSTTLTNVQNALNQAHQARLASQPWPFMLWGTGETFTCTVDQRVYALHQEFWRPQYFFNRDSRNYLIEVPPRALASTGARWNTDTNRPTYYRLTNRSPVQNQPSSASTLSIVSTDASDNTAAKAITVRGVTAEGVATEIITPNGTTTVTGTTSFTQILNVTKGAVWAGTLTMSSNFAAVTNLTLFASELSRSYQQLELLSAPQSADVIEYRFFRLPSPLSDDNDLPDIPPPHEQILVWDALLMIAGYNTEISTKTIAMWKDRQQQMDVAMQQAFLEGQTLESHPKFVRVIEDDESFPGFYR